MPPEYYRAWRRDHPEYRHRERRRKRERRRRMTPEERRKDRGNRSSAELVTVPPLHQGHALFDQARRLAAVTNGFRHYQHPFYDDLISEIVLGLLEGHPKANQEAFLARERSWLLKTISLEAWR